MTSRLVRVALPLCAAVAIFTVATDASAHVTVTAADAAAGASDVQITFRVPNENPSARTVAVTVRFPLDTPIADVLVQPTAGWSFTEKTAKLAKPIVTDDGDVTEAVSEIDWRATGTGIGGWRVRRLHGDRRSAAEREEPYVQGDSDLQQRREGLMDRATRTR